MTIIVRVHPRNLLSANHRTHWAVKARRTRVVRTLACLAARGHRRVQAADITVTVHPPDRRKRDVDNAMPTIKACIDGIVDAAVLPGDDSAHVRSLRLIPGDPTVPGLWVFAIDLEEQT